MRQLLCRHKNTVTHTRAKPNGKTVFIKHYCGDCGRDLVEKRSIDTGWKVLFVMYAAMTALCAVAEVWAPTAIGLLSLVAIVILALRRKPEPKPDPTADWVDDFAGHIERTCGKPDAPKRQEINE